MGDLKSESTAPWPADIDLNMEEIDKLLVNNEYQNAFEMSEFEEILKEGNFEFPEDFFDTKIAESEPEKLGESESGVKVDGNLAESVSSETSKADSSISSSVDELLLRGTGHIPVISVVYTCQFNVNRNHSLQLEFVCGPKCQSQIQYDPVEKCDGKEGGMGVVPTSSHGRGNKDLKATKIKDNPKKKRTKKVWPTENQSPRILRSSSSLLNAQKTTITIVPTAPQNPAPGVGKKIQKKIFLKEKSQPQRGRPKGKQPRAVAANQSSGKWERKSRVVLKTLQQSKRPKVTNKLRWTKPTARQMLFYKRFGLQQCKVLLTRLTFKLSKTTKKPFPENNGVIVGFGLGI